MDFLYTDAEACHFMDPVTYEQVSVPQFVEAGDRVRVDTEKVKYVDRVTIRRV